MPTQGRMEQNGGEERGEQRRVINKCQNNLQYSPDGHVQLDESVSRKNTNKHHLDKVSDIETIHARSDGVRNTLKTAMTIIIILITIITIMVVVVVNHCSHFLL